MLASAHLPTKTQMLKSIQQPTQISGVSLHILTKSIYLSIVTNISDDLCPYYNSVPELLRALKYR